MAPPPSSKAQKEAALRDRFDTFIREGIELSTKPVKVFRTSKSTVEDGRKIAQFVIEVWPSKLSKPLAAIADLAMAPPTVPDQPPATLIKSGTEHTFPDRCKALGFKFDRGIGKEPHEITSLTKGKGALAGKVLECRGDAVRIEEWLAAREAPSKPTGAPAASGRGNGSDPEASAEARGAVYEKMFPDEPEAPAKPKAKVPTAEEMLKSNG